MKMYSPLAAHRTRCPTCIRTCAVLYIEGASSCIYLKLRKHSLNIISCIVIERSILYTWNTSEIHHRRCRTHLRKRQDKRNYCTLQYICSRFRVQHVRECLYIYIQVYIQCICIQCIVCVCSFDTTRCVYFIRAMIIIRMNGIEFFFSNIYTHIEYKELLRSYSMYIWYRRCKAHVAIYSISIEREEHFVNQYLIKRNILERCAAMNADTINFIELIFHVWGYNFHYNIVLIWNKQFHTVFY